MRNASKLAIFYVWENLGIHKKKYIHICTKSIKKLPASTCLFYYFAGTFPFDRPIASAKFANFFGHCIHIISLKINLT